MLTNRDIILLRHIKQESEFLLAHSKQIDYNDFLENQILKRAFERSIEIIGEAAKKLSLEFKSQHNQMDWKAIAGMRDKLIHDYFGVDYRIVWDVATNKSAELLNYFDNILETDLENSLFM